MYVNGLSTSLPPDIQLAFLRSVPGLELVHMTRPGYAIEYDYFPPNQLAPTLEVRSIPGLFLAGQINGTTGYEEAAGQGALAGLNAALFASGNPPIVIPRESAFIGVMVDDLVTKGVDEPYRLFTSRSECRLLLRQDNALRRLLPLAEQHGLLTEEERRRAHDLLSREEMIFELATDTMIEPTGANAVLTQAGSTLVHQHHRIADLARRPGVNVRSLLAAAGIDVDEADSLWADLELKYAGYLGRDRERAKRLRAMDSFSLPLDLDYLEMRTLAFEARDRLASVRPLSLGQARRLPGITPSDLQCLVLEVIRRCPDVSRETGVDWLL
jgi:tRNA uridine 5-carboxymethylaminomethyl modification enzyme